MKVKNIFTKYKKTKEIFKDNRGIIADIFYKNSINHVAMIVSKPNVIRGNHYHKKTTQYILVTSGTLEYWYKKLNDKKKSRSIILKKGDLVSTPPKEIHALKIGKFGNEFVVFSKGLRGGIDYEKDTYRVPSIINSE
jgi:dTDP-4-dehydrorhamnose 3,5-epimerase-like enzyme